VTDALFILRTMVTRILPVLVLLLTYVMAIFSVPFAKTMLTSTLEIIQLAMAHFNAVDWSQVMAILRAHVMVVRPHVSQFLEAHQEALIAPLLWALLATVVLFWLPKPISTSPEPDPKELPSRRHRRALKQHNRKVTRRANVPQAGSIRSHGLHRRYPINLRSMGRYIRRNAPTLVEQQQQVQLNDLHSKVATLLQRVDSLKRTIPRSTHWTCRHCNDTIVHGPTEPCPKLRDTSRSPSDLSTQEEGPRINHCDVNDAYLDAPLRQQRRRARRLPKSNGVYRPVSPIGFQGLGNHQWTSKQLQAARKMAMQVNMAKFPNGNIPQSFAWLSSQPTASANPFPRLQCFQSFGTLVQASRSLLTARTLLDPSTPLAPSFNCRALQRDSGLKVKVMFSGQCKILWAT
jgi:hypothetical protein